MADLDTSDLNASNLNTTNLKTTNLNVSNLNTKSTLDSLDKDEIDIVIYHYPCCDGFGSAYIVKRYYQETNNTRDIKYIGVGYGSKVPNVKDKNVLICDYSYPLSVMKKIQCLARSVLIIDHHKTAQHDLKSIDDSCKIFNMDHSGAVLTWKYFYSDIEVPMMLQYIEDIDIWKKELPDNDAFSAWFNTIDTTFELYDTICTCPGELEKGIEIGKSFIRINRFNKLKIASKSAPKLIEFTNRGMSEYKMVAHVNSSVLASDIGHCAFDVHPFIDFSTVYSVKDYSNTTTFSLRSTNYHTDVGTLSKNYLGSGGHHNASGAMIPAITTCLSGRVYNIDIYNVITNGISFETSNYESLQVAYLNTPHQSGILCKYLMQTKFVFEDENISTVRSIKAISETLEVIDEVNWDEGSDFLTKYQENLRKSEPIELVGIWSYKRNETHFNIIFTNKGEEIIDKLMSLHLKMETVLNYTKNAINADGIGTCSFNFCEMIGVRSNLD